MMSVPRTIPSITDKAGSHLPMTDGVVGLGKSQDTLRPDGGVREELLELPATDHAGPGDGLGNGLPVRLVYQAPHGKVSDYKITAKQRWEPVKEKRLEMWLDGEPFVRSLAKIDLSHAPELGGKLPHVLEVSDVLDHGVRECEIEGVSGELQMPSIANDSFVLFVSLEIASIDIDQRDVRLDSHQVPEGWCASHIHNRANALRREKAGKESRATLLKGSPDCVH